MTDEGFLPDWADIKPSTIDGVRYGIFTNQFIEEGTELVVIRAETEDGIITRSVVGFIGNCDDGPDPNVFCEREWCGRYWSVWIGAARDIEVGEEIMWRYTLPEYGEPGSRPWQ